jgi:hypothetical protein
MLMVGVSPAGFAEPCIPRAPLSFLQDEQWRVGSLRTRLSAPPIR